MPLRQTSAWISAARPFQRSRRALVVRGHGIAPCAVECHPRHHLRMHEMLRRRAHLPDPLVGQPPDPLEMVEEGDAQRPAPRIGGKPAAHRMLEHVGELAVDVELGLARGGIAHAHGARSFEAAQPVELALVQVALPGHAVHDLQLLRASRHRAYEPVLPGIGFLGVARVQEGEQGERRVAQPAIAIVPVARAADQLRQRGRRRGHDAAGRAVSEPLQRHQRAAHRARPPSRDAAAA